MCSMAHAAKVGDGMGGVGRGVFGAIALSLAIGFMTALVYTLYLGYDMGASQLKAGGFESGAKGYWTQLETFSDEPAGHDAVPADHGVERRIDLGVF